MEETGTLPVGIEYEGKLCTEFTLREQIVGDSVAVFESDDAERALANDAFYGVCIMARRVSVDGIPEGGVTPDMLMQARQLDFDELHAASGRLDKRRLEFRSQADAGAADASGAAKTGV
jgi:phage FluMu protein gp41